MKLKKKTTNLFRQIHVFIQLSFRSYHKNIIGTTNFLKLQTNIHKNTNNKLPWLHTFSFKASRFLFILHSTQTCFSFQPQWLFPNTQIFFVHVRYHYVAFRRTQINIGHSFLVIPKYYKIYCKNDVIVINRDFLNAA